MRLPVLAETADWLALEKPAGVGLRAYPWDSELDLDAALNMQLQAGKPELVRRGATLFGSIYYLDPAISGVAVFAKNRDALADLRNRFGSGECTFRFQFVAAGQPVGGAGGVGAAPAPAALAPQRQAEDDPLDGQGQKGLHGVPPHCRVA